VTDRSTTAAPAVSVVVIFLNAETFLQEAVESVLAQTFTDWELFLVDDGSTDGSTEIARSYAARFPGKVIYLEHEGHTNKGMTASRNLGIAHARGEFVAPLDADDVWFPEKLKTQVRLLNEHPEATMVAAPSMYWYADGAKTLQPMALNPGILEPGAWIPRILEKDDNTACPSAVMIRTAALRAAGGFESSFKGPLMVFEDQVMWFKMTLSAPVYFHPEPVLFYRIHSASYCASTPSDVQLAGRLVLYTRLAHYVRTSPRPVRRRSLLLQMARARIGELLLRTEPSHREAARALDASGAVDRQSVGLVLLPVLLAGSIAKGKAIALFRKIFDLLFVAYHDGALSSARALPDLALSATRSLFLRSQP
jgi:glycosyltransferase involved in cell wall biosynthesis